MKKIYNLRSGVKGKFKVKILLLHFLRRCVWGGGWLFRAGSFIMIKSVLVKGL